MNYCNFIAPFNTSTSYGLVANNIAEYLTCRCIPVSVDNVSNNIKSKTLESILDKSDIDLSLPTLKLWHQNDLSMIGKNKKIGYTFFELDTFSYLEKASINSCDILLVATEWAKKVCENNGINIPIHVVPLGVDERIFNYTKHIYTDTYTFLSCGKWEVRKSQNEIVEAFNLAFTPNDNVQLILSLHNQFYPEQFLENIKSNYLKTKMGKVGKIKFVGPFNDQKDLVRIMHMADCGVFPSKAEGWGLETLEMMACGKHVIVTDYAGHTQFCNKDNAHLIKPTGLVKAEDGKWFYKQGNWCTFDVNEIISHMRTCCKQGPAVNEQGIFTAKKFTWQNTVKLIESIL